MDLRLALQGSLSVGDAFIGVYDDRDFLRYANDAFLRAFELQAGEVATFSSIIRDAARQKKGVRIEAGDPLGFIADVQVRRRLLAHPPRQRTFPVDFVDGRWFWCTETLLVNRWIVLSGTDITLLKTTERQLEGERDRALLMSGVDELTGLPNRRSALARLDKLLTRAVAGDASCCVGLLDLDRFKAINDTHGHAAGDAALCQFARYCATSLMRQAFISRLGGEEFLILFHGISSQEAKVELERILSSIPLIPLAKPSGATLKLSFSAGLAEARSGDWREDVLSQADKALYAAKQAGRGRIEIFQPSARESV
ncbi:GGDEF domain-containing protein [Caballeronia sp. LZ019]|uniref:GGDEF domain-containing protein n=1 Tax=Caballeronia sp. LZ019 TaxID=3038555 RepID=UPI00285886CC|nr:GGDEF domain-containing protein [Caballeronia sp. LZ019]MDR5809818.1 GGDEF domain-containing protein [Caballeronia sp. LZ019]